MTKTAEKPGAVEALETVEVSIQSIRVQEQHRRLFDDKKIKELAGSIEKVGVLAPLLVRLDQENPGHLLLVAGERRLRAAKLAGLTKVPVRVGSWDDKAAAEIQALENLHRQDLTPIEEARAFDMLLKAGGYDVKSLAEHIDKSEAYVYRALALLELPEKFLRLIESGELTPAHGHQVMRLPADRRKEAISWTTENVSDFPTAKALKEHVDRDLGTDLKTALFPTGKDYAGEVACAKCDFNSGNQGLLFDGATKGRCMMAACFQKKTEQAHLDMAEEGKKAFPGLEYIGLGEQDSNYPRKCGITGVAALSDAEAKQKKIRQLVEEKPTKFAIAVLKPPYWSEKKIGWRWALVCKEPALVGGIIPGRGKSSSSSSAGTSKGDEQKDGWIRQRTMALLVKSVLQKVKKANDTMLRRIALAVGEFNHNYQADEQIKAFFNIEGTPCHPDDLAELSRDQVLIYAWAQAIDFDDMEQVGRETGLDGEALQAAAEKQAEEAYEKEQPAKKAGKAKGAPDAGGSEEGEE